MNSCLGRIEGPVPNSLPDVPGQAFWSEGAGSYTRQSVLGGVGDYELVP